MSILLLPSLSNPLLPIDGCFALSRMAHTTERATTLLFSHPTLITTIATTIADVEEDDENEEHLAWARSLLERFPAEVQHAVTKLQLEDSERMWRTLNGTAKALTRDNAALTSDLEDSKEEVRDLTRDNAALANDLAASKDENESLRAALSEGANGEELAALISGAKAANAASRAPPVRVKREGESGEGGEEREGAKKARK